MSEYSLSKDKDFSGSSNPIQSVTLSFRENATLMLALILFVAVYAPTMGWLFERWTMSVWHHAHGLFIPPIVGYLVWQRLRLFRHLPRESSAWGFAIIVPALLLHVLDVGIHTQILSAVSIVILLPGMALLFLGARRTKEIAFLLLFLFFMLPIPLSMTRPLHLVLRDITAANIAYVVPELGIPIFVDGTMIHLPNTKLLVADACSGFSTLYAMVAVACLTVHVSRHRIRSLLVLLIAGPIAIVANTIRSIILVLAVFWYDTPVLETWIHPFSGMFTMILGLAVLFSVGGIFSPQAVEK